MKEPRLDRTAFWAGKFEENETRIMEYWQTKSVRERLIAAEYLNSIAFGYDLNNPPRMDKTAFSMRKSNG